ncbi:hypothetical protein [Actinomadura sp. DC4]|uniref:hypothetical protein n=1 Tax=Actinomadura sp. DC4 TaxID=3055069 RepID=UPI0025B054BA|nr:hypothetical protein [Actinomadura sp. DC4]MDN3352670.1 hypothetical protein [Actinomadura sp. DC4]
MLTRFSSAIVTVVLAGGAILALDATSASACGPTGHVCAATGRTIPGRPAPKGGGGGGGGGGGKAAPMPCPGAVNCNAIGAGAAAAPVQRVPTIDVAYNAENQLALPAPHVHTSPDGKTYVDLRTGLWVAPGDFARETAAATVPGQVVTAVATPKDVTWNMGEGTVVCGTAGSATGNGCGYTYKRSSAGQPDGKYAISVTVTWSVYWTCAGDCDAAQGTFADPTMAMTTNTTLAVGEVQTESRPG